MRTIEQIQETQKKSSITDLKVGDYVFATKFHDAIPTDRWMVGIVDRLDSRPSVYFKDTGVIPFRFAQKISDEEGAMILEAWETMYP